MGLLWLMAGLALSACGARVGDDDDDDTGADDDDDDGSDDDDSAGGDDDSAAGDDDDTLPSGSPDLTLVLLYSPGLGQASADVSVQVWGYDPFLMDVGASEITAIADTITGFPASLEIDMPPDPHLMITGQPAPGTAQYYVSVDVDLNPLGSGCDGDLMVYGFEGFSEPVGDTVTRSLVARTNPCP